MRRAERRRERAVRTVVIVASLVTAAAVTGVSYSVFTEKREEQRIRKGLLTGEQRWGALGRNHVSESVDYSMAPPVGGDHDQAWANCNGEVYSDEIRNENAVHSLEHGAVWVTYNDTAADADIRVLTDRVSKTPYTFMSPYKKQSSPITLTAWGRQLSVRAASDPRVAQFFTKYVQGEQTPEPGAPCTGGSAG
ncbi:DUF3105 domain-containing protein [Streptomyces sp. NPDC096046]|uniref:DUF3105 domain-containing protein n=1 Tax=Streptomyces sp. NPDC096046 TaxID=3155542 RepID=UPI00332CF59F